LKLDENLDVIVPRGGEELIRFVAEHSRIPVIKHYKGVCHVYVHSKADLNMAHRITMNAKLQKPGVCNAMETLLVDRNVARKFLPSVIADLQKAGCEIRGDAATRAIVKGDIKKATQEDWRTEYLDLILSIRVVGNLKDAIEHINSFGSHHSDTIVTQDKKQAQIFLNAVDSACVYVNASTRFTDGYEFGFGAEVGISTDKLHVRGPMALEGLTSYKYEVYGTGQIRV
jgi:glutamate-5-semialdehyde dehydrogenase